MHHWCDSELYSLNLSKIDSNLCLMSYTIAMIVNPFGSSVLVYFPIVPDDWGHIYSNFIRRLIPSRPTSK